METELDFNIGECPHIAPLEAQMPVGGWIVAPYEDGFRVLGGPLALEGFVRRGVVEFYAIESMLEAKDNVGLYRYLDRICVKQLPPGVLLAKIEERRLAAYEQGRADMRGKILDTLTGTDALARTA